MKTKGAVIALAVLFGGLGFGVQVAEARAPEARNQAKPAGRPAAAAVRPVAPARAQGAARSDATARGSAQRQQAAVRSASVAAPAPARRGGGRGAYSARGRGLSCVPHVRQVTGMAISGNGRDWWHNAAGLYARSNRPEVGSVMAFPGSGGMPMGHVAVVERVVSSREVLIHHANWGGPGIPRGSIMRGVSVIDVSPNNDWTQVRVQTGRSAETYGRIYPVYGFIHNRPDPTGGALFAGSAPRGGPTGLEQVAEAPPARSATRR